MIVLATFLGGVAIESRFPSSVNRLSLPLTRDVGVLYFFVLCFDLRWVLGLWLGRTWGLLPLVSGDRDTAGGRTVTSVVEVLKFLYASWVLVSHGSRLL